MYTLYSIAFMSFINLQVAFGSGVGNNNQNFCAWKCIIPSELDFQCASNGVTYLNLYEFQCAKRFCFTDLELQHPGMCRSPKITAKVKKLQNFVKPKKMKKCEVDDCLCDYGYFPVCGSNGITYGNACILNCSKICIPGLQQIHLGPCAASIIFRDNIPNKYFTYTFNSSNLRLLFDTIRSCLTSDRN